MSNTTVSPTKQEIEGVFSRLRSQPANKVCFDCSAKAPTWSSVTYGVFICIDCSAVHRSLGVHLTFVRSTNLDTNWTWLQLRQMQLGGNANAAQFFRQHNCNTTDAQQKYNSRAAQLYRDKLVNMAQQAMKVHGTKLYLDNGSYKLEGNDPKIVTEEDFFAECENDNNPTILENNNIESSSVIKNIELTRASLNSPNIAMSEKQEQTSIGAPSVDLLNSVVPPASYITSSIGVRKIQPKKSGLGARKTGGLGATKVKTNFAEIEQRANLANEGKEPVFSEKPCSTEEDLAAVASMRLAYQDLSIQKTREEAKLRTIDPVKAKQMERLGMGFNMRGVDVSHSALNDMETIQQSAPTKTSQSKFPTFESDSFFNEYSPTMYSSSSVSTGSKTDKQELDMMGFETIEPIGSCHSNITSMFAGSDGDPKQSSTKTTPAGSTEHGKYSRKSGNQNKSATNSENDAAQKKFGSAKGFGSDQFFDNEQKDPDVSTNLSRFQGSNSISSSDYFSDGTKPTNRGPRGYSSNVNFQAPDLDDVKESVRQSVHTVAGRLSSLATDFMSSLQDKYGY